MYLGDIVRILSTFDINLLLGSYVNYKLVFPLALRRNKIQIVLYFGFDDGSLTALASDLQIESFCLVIAHHR
jgi:hypothetical protein